MSKQQTMTSPATSFVTDEQLKEMELKREDCRALGTELRLPAFSPELRRRLYALNNAKMLLSNEKLSPDRRLLMNISACLTNK